jgi:hypothetical protein
MFGRNARKIASLTDLLRIVTAILDQQVKVNLLLAHRLDVLEARADEPCEQCLQESDQ